MKTAANYLDAIRAKHQLKSDSQAAALLGVTRASASRFRNGEDSFSDETAAKVAELTGADPNEVLIYAHLQRAKDERARALWVNLARTIGIMSTSTRRRPGFRDDDDAPQASTEQARNCGFFFAH